MEKVKCILCGKETENWVIMFRFIFMGGKLARRKITCCKDCFGVSEQLLELAEAVSITPWLLASKVDLEKLPE